MSGRESTDGGDETWPRLEALQPYEAMVGDAAPGEEPPAEALPVGLEPDIDNDIDIDIDMAGLDEPDQVALDAEPDPDLVSPSTVLRYLDEAEHDPSYDEALPGILKMPEGMKVDERRVGRAVAAWVLHVRCDCGRRWFETEAVDSATCPRCGLLVYVDIDARRSRR